MYRSAFQHNPFLLYSDSFWDASNPLKDSGNIPADNTSLSAINDLAKRGNNWAQGTGANQPTYKTGIINGNNVFRFDGTADNMTVAHAASNDYSGAMTIVAAINTTSIASTRRIFSKASAAAGGFAFGINQSRIIFTARDVSDYQTTTGIISASTWTVIAAVYNGSDSVTFYKDRSSVSTHSGGAVLSTTGPLILGAQNGPSEFWTGDCQNLFWAWRVLNAGELAIILDETCKRVGL